ncbi:hypothetical protein AB0F93_00150 [Micromonospora tulbaghiae]|uniref:hypothetical protein n=1 Tax=Micromonospora tulbaghiae TaxID=479978 RepID=UPI003329C3C3
MTEPTSSGTATPALPHAAVVELVERHFDGEKKPTTGHGSLIMPNHLRIDGIAVYATEDAPATLHEVVLDGRPGTPFAVTLSLFARAIRVGEGPAFTPGALGGPDASSAAVVEIPDVEVLEPGAQLDLPYVLLNGQPVFISPPGVAVTGLTTSWADVNLAQVTITLPCRRLVVDDEVCQPAPATA